MGGIIHVVYSCTASTAVTPENFFILRRPIKLSLDPLLGYQREERLYFVNRQRNSHFLVVKKRCAHSKQLRSILHWLCLFKSSGSVVSRVASSMTQAVTIFSGQSVISRVYTSRFGNGMVRLENSTEVVLKKVTGTRYCTQWKTPQKLTIPCRTMQWKSTKCCIWVN